MSTTDALRSVHTRPRLSGRLVLDFLAALDRRARARHQLAHLDDRILRDIGLTRDDVRAELRKPLL